MTSSADAPIHALRSGHDELVALVADLGAEDLAAPSAASAWDLAQVLSHLGSGAEIALATLRKALQPGLDSESNEAIWDRWNAMSPREQLTGFLTADEALVEAYEALDEETRETLQIDLGFLPAPVDVATAASFRLNELALHSWDIRSVFDPAATVAPEATPHLLGPLSGLLAWIGKADAVQGDVLLLVETTEPTNRFGVVITDAVSLGDVPDSATATLTLPAEAWVRLITGRMGPDRTPDSVGLSSATLELADLRRVFPGY